MPVGALGRVSGCFWQDAIEGKVWRCKDLVHTQTFSNKYDDFYGTI